MRRLAVKLLASSAMVVGCGEIASAQPFSWTGFYVGANAGYRWADADVTASPFSFRRVRHSLPFNIPAWSDTFNPDSGIFGLHGGYNHQFSPNWLMGLEVDVSWGSRSDTHSLLSSDGFITLTRNSTVELGWQGSVRGRLGWVNGPWLFYGTGGVAFVDAKWTDNWPGVVVAGGFPSMVTASKTLTGLVGGGGLEYLFAPRWLVRVEYLFTDYGRFTVPLAATTIFGNVNVTTQVVRVGLSYKLTP